MGETLSFEPPRGMRDFSRRLHRAGRRGRRGAEATGALPDLERALLSSAADAAA